MPRPAQAEPARAAACAAVTLALLAAAVAAGSPQIAPIRPPMRAGERVATGGLDRYRGLYGEPEFRTLDDESSRPWPRMQNIRTIGSFSAIPGKGGSSALPPQVGRRVEFDSKYTTHMICGRTYCLALVAVPELRDLFFQVATSWQYQDVEVIGAIDNVAKPTPYSQEPPTYAFQVWSISLATGGTTRHARREGPTLESLVRGPEAAAGRAITVSGVFRGANLFGDLPDESRRQASDWVLQDGAFSVWVSGREPKGGGWSLDPRSKTDCTFRLEVRGRVEAAGGLVYLRAKEVTLLGRVRPDDGRASDSESR